MLRWKHLECDLQTEGGGARGRQEPGWGRIQELPGGVARLPWGQELGRRARDKGRQVRQFGKSC